MTANPLSTIPPIGPATGMAPTPPTGRFKPIDPVRLMRQHVKLLIFTGILGLIMGVGLYIGLRKTMPEYTSEAKLRVSTGSVENPFDLQFAGGDTGRIDGVLAYMNNEANFIVSEEIIRDALGRPNSKATAWLQSFDGDVTEARQIMQDEMLRASALRGTTLISITMTGPTPNDARVLLDEILATYLTRKQRENELSSTSLRKLFISEENRSDDDIRRLRKQMDRFIAEHQIETLGVSQSEEQIAYNRLFEQMLDLTFMLEAAQGQYESLQQSTGSAIMTDEENAFLKTLPHVASRQEELRRLAEMRRQFLAKNIGENHESVKDLDRRAETVQFELDGIMDTELGEMRALQVTAAAKQVEGLNGQIAGLQPRLEETAGRLQELTQKLTEYNALEIDLQIVMEKKKRADAALDALRTISNREDSIKIRRQSDSSDPVLSFPHLIIVPGVTLLVMGLIGGIVVLREMLDQRVRSPMDLKLLPEANLLGLVPNANEDPSGGGSAERTVERTPTGLLAESYRQIRTAVLSKMDRRGYKTLVCVSPQPNAGTSTFIQNLATSLAYNGRSVLIIDANFRRPSQHKLMDTGNDRGLIDVLKDDAEVDDIIVSHPDTSLSLLPTGHAADSPPELLEGAAFRGLLGQLETQYDVILIDTPPALLTSDSQLLSKHVDAIAVVVRAGSDKRGMLGRMLNQLDGQRADVLGIVLNGVKSAAGGYFRKSYEDFYRYRQDGSTSTKRSAKPKKEKPAKAKRNGKTNGDPLDRGVTTPEPAAAPTTTASADDDIVDLDEMFLDDDGPDLTDLKDS